MEFLMRLSERTFASNAAEGLIGSVDFNLWLAQFSGVPLVGLREETKLARCFSLLFGVPALIIVTCAYFVFEIYDLLLNYGNIFIVTQNICLSLTHLAGLYKILNTFYRYPEVREILRRMRDIAKCYVTSEKQIKTFLRGEFETKVPLMIYATLVATTGILGFAMLLSNPSAVAGEIFPYRVKLPECLPTTFQLFYMGLSVLIYALQIVSIDYLNITMMNQICLQLKILNLAFENFSLGTDVIRQKKDWQKPFNKQLKVIIKHHCELRILRDKVERIFSTPVLIQFATSLVIFGMTGFQAIIQPSGSKSAILIYFYCGCTFCELFLYCWFGNEVFEQSKTLATSGFSSTWYNYDKSFRKSTLIFMTNAQKPFLFTAGGFMDLSLPSFAGILSKSYSFIALLRQVYSRQ